MSPDQQSSQPGSHVIVERGHVTTSEFRGQTPPRQQGRIAFNATTFRGPTRRGRILVQASGGPASISTPLRELGKTGRT
jgi:hypothetical protein